jgi:Fic family protein
MALSSGIPSISGFDEKRKAMLSVSSMMEESIASSQIEGAVTTTREAKRMLRDGAAPRDRSEQMILNNYKAMGFIRSNLDRELTPDLIRELHGIMTHDTLESLEYEGTFRTDNSIAVRDVLTGEICYEPVSFERIGLLMEGLCAFFNDEEGYIHPIIKAILVHFILAYIHPFMDGNGRVSRSLFYWYAMREGYSLMEYLSISKAIREHKGRYEEAYRLSETDGNDVTYFIDYNLDMIMQSMDVFSEYLREKLEERRSIRDIMDTEDLTRRQTDVLASLMNSDSPLSVYDLSSEMGVSPQTVRNDLNVLIGKGYVRESTKDGHRLRYSYSEKRSKNGSQ